MLVCYERLRFYERRATMLVTSVLVLETSVTGGQRSVLHKHFQAFVCAHDTGL